MRTIANVLWLLFSGIEMALSYLVAGLLAIVFIVTIPVAPAAFRLANYTLWPFGRVVVRRPEAGAVSTLANVVWFLIAGWWLALLHLGFGVVLAITIIGIPFAIVHVKLAGLALRPYGKDVVEARFAHQHEVVLAPPQPLGTGR
ncbi:MAG: YccF domain-containing protein [Nitriliruptoraceae bacterium]